MQCGGRPLSTLLHSPPLCQGRGALAGVSATGFANAIIDTVIFVLPVRMVWSLQMSYGRKWAVSAMFSLGLIGVIISIARAVRTFYMSRFDSAFIIWSTAEAAIALICACLPSLRPLFARCYARIASSIPRKSAPTERPLSTKITSPTSRDATQRDRRDEDKVPLSREVRLVDSHDCENQ
ncbi:hypothetical protein N7G274_005849 [Stereocaulon virgatum]|uniref:Rhodopsin domain-containing protein n=1 Tax=Stereocaulon virgatum TaxID=373712 RepID=A0ABR4A6D7_9LECA